jgi:hypothetical protein
LKPGGYWFIKMNPYYSKEELESFGYENMRGDWLDYTRDLWEYLPDRDVWEPRAGITMWKPDYFTFSAGTDQGGYIGCAKDGLWMYSPEKDK